MLFDFPLCDCNRPALIRCIALGSEGETIKGVCSPPSPIHPPLHSASPLGLSLSLSLLAPESVACMSKEPERQFKHGGAPGGYGRR